MKKKVTIDSIISILKSFEVFSREDIRVAGPADYNCDFMSNFNYQDDCAANVVILGHSVRVRRKGVQFNILCIIKSGVLTSFPFIPGATYELAKLASESYHGNCIIE